jgi:hypothetical protein
LAPQNDVRYAAIDPNRRFIATGTHHYPNGPGVKVWNAETGECIAEIPVGASAVTFSADGRWLTTNADGVHRFWNTGTWDEGPRFGSSGKYVAFYPIGAVAAVDDGWETIRLLDLNAGRELTRLTAPVGGLVVPLCFTPDGAKLVVQGVETLSLFVIDIAAVRRDLAEMGLDWSNEPLTARAVAVKPDPLKFVVDLGGFRERQAARELVTQANRLFGERKHADALDLLRKAVAKDPKFCTAQNNLAWRLLTGPMDQRDAKAALVHARAAVQHCGEGSHNNTHGLALLRNGEIEDAMTQFDESLCRSGGRDDGCDYFLLAVCHRKIGDSVKADECHRLGDRWLAANRHRLSPGMIQELEAFQAEAKAK